MSGFDSADRKPRPQGANLRRAAACAAVLLALCVAVETVPAAEPTTSKAPNFKGVDMNGDKVALQDLLGKGPVVVHFWATWCKPCIKELPYLQRLHEQHAERGLQVVAVSIDSPKSQSQVKKFIATRGYTFRVLLDGDQEIFKKLQGRGSVPYGVVLDHEGMVQYQHTGYRPGDEKKLEAVVLGLMGVEAKAESDTLAAPPEVAPPAVEAEAGG